MMNYAEYVEAGFVSEMIIVKEMKNPNYKGAIWDKMNITFSELSKTLNGPDAVNIQINSIIKIFIIITKRDTEALGYYWKSNVTYVLNRICNICDKNKNEKYVKMFYGLFANNKATGKAYMTCEVETLMSALWMNVISTLFPRTDF